MGTTPSDPLRSRSLRRNGRKPALLNPQGGTPDYRHRRNQVRDCASGLRCYGNVYRPGVCPRQPPKHPDAFPSYSGQERRRNAQRSRICHGDGGTAPEVQKSLRESLLRCNRAREAARNHGPLLVAEAQPRHRLDDWRGQDVSLFRKLLFRLPGRNP